MLFSPVVAMLLSLALAAPRPSGDYLELPLVQIPGPTPRLPTSYPLGVRFAMEVDVLGAAGDDIPARRVRLLVDTGSSTTLLIEDTSALAEESTNGTNLVEEGELTHFVCAKCEKCIDKCTSGEDECAEDCDDRCEAPESTTKCKAKILLSVGITLDHAFEPVTRAMGLPCEHLKDVMSTASNATTNATNQSTSKAGPVHCAGPDALYLPSSVHVHLVHPCELALGEDSASDAMSPHDRRSFWSGLGGVLGVSYWPGWPRIPPLVDEHDDDVVAWLWPRLLGLQGDAPGAITVALDLRLSGGESALVLGGDWVGQSGVVWAESQARVKDSFRVKVSTAEDEDEGVSSLPGALDDKECYDFALGSPGLMAFDLSVCGQALTASASSWPVNITTATSCLVLPGELFDTVMRLIPSECEGTDHTARSCLVPKGLDDASTLADLPALSFALSEGGPRLHIPLGDLVLAEDAQESRRSYCIHSADYSDPGQQNDPEASPQLLNGTRIPVVLGAHVLTRFVTVVDMALAHPRVGLIQREGLWTSAQEQAYFKYCEARTQCEGDTVFEPSHNRCHEPECLVYFQVFDKATGTCRYSSAFRLVGILVITLLAIADLTMNEVYKHLTHHIRMRMGIADSASSDYSRAGAARENDASS